MLPLRLEFHQQAVQGCVHLLCLWSTEGVSGTAVLRENLFSAVLKQQKGKKKKNKNPQEITSSCSVANSSRMWPSLSLCRARLWPWICIRLQNGCRESKHHISKDRNLISADEVVRTPLCNIPWSSVWRRSRCSPWPGGYWTGNTWTEVCTQTNSEKHSWRVLRQISIL